VGILHSVVGFLGTGEFLKTRTTLVASAVVLSLTLNGLYPTTTMRQEVREVFCVTLATSVSISSSIPPMFWTLLLGTFGLGQPSRGKPSSYKVRGNLLQRDGSVRDTSQKEIDAVANTHGAVSRPVTYTRACTIQPNDPLCTAFFVFVKIGPTKFAGSIDFPWGSTV
jgi:hypothetical protein